MLNKIYRVERPEDSLLYPEDGHNAVVIVAGDSVKAKELAVANCISLVDDWDGGVTEDGLVVTDITHLLLTEGSVIAKE